MSKTESFQVNIADFGYFHDYKCVRVAVSEAGAIDLETVSWDNLQRVGLHFSEVEEFQFVDLALGNIIAEMREIAFDDLDDYEPGNSYPPFSKRELAAMGPSNSGIQQRKPSAGLGLSFSKRSLSDVINSLSSEDAKRYRLWVIIPSYGLAAAILAGDLTITRRPMDPCDQ